MKQVYKTSTQKIDPTVDINTDACLVAQVCLTLWDPKDCSPPGSSVHGTLQARVLWVAISFSRGSSRPRHRTRVLTLNVAQINRWLYSVSGGDNSVLGRGHGKASCTKQGKVTSKFTTKFMWASRLRSAEWCGLWKLVTDNLIGPDTPACTVPQNVFECASGTLPSFFPLKRITSVLLPFLSLEVA